MSDQNIYDNQEFFNKYFALCEREDSYNDLLEQPAMTDMLPDLTGKTVVLDLGCGYGHNCIDFIKRGWNGYPNEWAISKNWWKGNGAISNMLHETGTRVLLSTMSTAIM